MQNTESLFWSLLQAGLWNKAPQDITEPLSAKQWKLIWDTGAKQTVLGLLYDGICMLPEALQPDSELKKKWLFFTVRTEQMHRLLNRSLADIMNRLDKEGIRSMLLKGQGNATFYENPLRRQCGDIDLYVGRENYDRVCQLVHQWGIVTDEESESIKHLHFEWDKVDVEIHRIPAFFPLPTYQKRFIEWSEEVLQHSQSGFTPADEVTNVVTPPPVFNALFIFYHLFYHFITGGIGLRQLCDLARCLHTLQSQIDRAELKFRLQDLGLMRPWQVFGYILVTTIGLDEKEFPFYDASMKKTAQKVLHRIEAEGNFGFFVQHRRQRPEGYVAGKIYSLIYNGKRYPALACLFPELTLTHFIFYVTNGVAHVFMDRKKFEENKEKKAKA
jgi:succinate dehydrogenase/fumarate reductase cytochrome b subunit